MGLFTIIAAVLGVVSFAASYQAAKKAQKMAKRARAGMAGVLVNKESSNEHIPVVYGERRVGGTRVFMSTSGVDRHKYLYVALVLSEGEVEAIEDIEIDEVPLSDARFNGLVYVNKKYGTDDQTPSNLLQEAFVDEEDIIDEWEGISVPDYDQYAPNFKLSGVAYLGLRMEYDREVFNGIPDITAKVKGRKVYDPRQDSTSSYYDSSVGVATQRANDTSTWEWSDNPAICLRDYLLNKRFGKDLPSSAIDQAKFVQAANDLDGFTVTPYSGGPTDHKLFSLNAVVDTGEELFKNVEQMLLACRGFLPYNFGKYALKIDQATTSQMTIGTDKIVGDIAIAGSKKEDRFNQVIVTFPNAGTNFRPDNAIWPNPSSSLETSISDGQGGFLTEAELHDQFLLEDGEELIDEIDLEYCTDRYAARDLARIFCWRSRYAVNVAFTATSEAMELEVGDVIGITHPTPDWTAKKFQIDEMNLNFDGTVAIKAIEHVQSIYAYDPDAEEVFGPDRVRPQPDVLAPTNFSGNNNGSALLADGTFHAVLNMSWTASTDVFVIEYEVAWRLPGDSYSYLKTPDTSVRIEGLEPGTYQIRVRAINYRGATSDWVVGANVNVTNDDTLPNLPTNIEALGDLESIRVTWTNPTDTDFKGVEIFASDVATAPSTNDTPTAFRTGTGFLETGLYPGQTRHYYLRSVDFTGNKSAFSSRVFAEATGVRVRNLALLVNQNAYPTNLPANEIRFNEEYEILTHGTTDFTDLGAADNNVGTVFTATRNGDPQEGSGTVEHTSYESNNGELALVASTIGGAPIYGESGSILWNGDAITVEHNNSNSFTVLTNLAEKQGWIAFDRNGTAPFDMSGALGNFDTGFVYYEDGQWYYDDDSANPVSFNPDSFTGTTTGTDGTSTAKLVALGALKTGSSADSISEAGLFSDPRDLKTVELPQNFIEVTNFATQLESDTYVQDTSGWKIERSGDVEFNNITARGEIHATSGSISESVQIGGTDLNDYVSRATGSLALMINKKSGGTLTGNGEAVLVGVEQGAAVTQQNGFITWDGAQVEIDYNQTAQSATFATQVQEQRGFICVDVNKETPFTINSGSGTVNVDVAFVYKIDDQWYYDNNSSSTTGVSFTPSTLVGSDGSSATELVAIGFIETGSSDVIKYGGLFGQPVALELAAMPADALESGSIGGIKISNNKLYQGNGNFKDANTGFYLDSGGDFSLKDKLFFDNSAGQLTVKGEIDAETLNVVEASVLGGINATSITDGIVSFDSFSEQALSSLDTRFGRTGGFFDEEYLTGYDGTESTSVSLSPVSHDGATNFVLSWGATKSWVSSTNISGDGLKLKVTFRYTAGGVITTLGTTQTFAATKTQLQDGNYVYDFSELTRLEVTGSTISAGTITLGVLVEEFSAASNCFELASDALLFEFRANQDNPDLTVTGTFIGSGLTYPTADGTNGQVITTDGSGNLSFTSAAGGVSDVVDDTSPQLGGDLESNGNDILFADNDKAKFGAGSDLQIYHDGSNSYITEIGTGILGIGTNGSKVIINKSPFENMAEFITDGAVNLYHNNVQKFATTSTGIDVTGTITFDGGTTSADLNFGDNDKAIFGAGSDLQIYHDGSNSYVRDVGTGHLNISGEEVRILNSINSEIKALFTTDGSVELYHDNAKKIETTSTGINVTGNATFDDNGKAIFGAGSDLQIYHDGANSYINDTAGTGNLYIASNQLIINNAANSENMARFAQDGAATLYHNGSAKIATTSTGVEITGAATVGGNTVWHAGNDGAGSGLAADTLDGYHAAQTSGDWFEHIPKVDSNGNMEIGRFTDWHYTDTSTATYDARSEILSTGVLRHTTGYGYIDLGPNNASYAHIQTDRSRFYFNKRIIVDEGIILSYNEDLQLGAGYGASTSITIDYATNEVTFNESINIANSKVISHNQTETRDKIRVWNNSTYAIGFDSAYTYGHLSNYAMTFQMSNTDDRGWVFLDSAHTDAQGAMSLTTIGEMTVATSLSIGEGQSITSPQSDVLYVKGNPNFAAMPTFETEGKIIISRADNVDREHEIRFNNSSLNADNYITFAVHNGSVGNQVEVMRLQGDGKVGIGVASPSGRVHADGDAYTAFIADGTSGGAFKFYKNGSQHAQIFSDGSGDIVFRNNTDSERMRIDSSGNVGINNTSPDTSLHIGDISATNATGQGQIKLEASSGSLAADGGLEFVSSPFGSGYGWKMNAIDPGGGVHLVFGTRQNATAWSEKMRILASGNVGINKTNPSAKFHVSGTARFDHSESQGFRTVVTDNIGDRTFYGHHLDVNMSGSDTLTADRYHYGLYLDVDSSATGGDTSNEHRVYGIYSDTRVTGDSDLVNAAYHYARADHSSGTISTLRGVTNSGMAHNASGTVSNTYGAFNIAYDFTSGTGAATNMYGSQNLAIAYSTSPNGASSFFGAYNMTQVTGTQSQNISQLVGTYSEVQIDANVNTPTISNAYVVRADYDYNDGDSGVTVSSGYLYYGSYSGTTPTNAWGLYINNAVKNYISGNLLIGKTSPAFGTAGVELNNADVAGKVWITRSGGEPLALNRLSSDGSILEFYKDGSQAGLIGANSGYLVIGSPVGSDAHLLIGNNLIHPATSTGASKDASIDIGGSSNRFKELYLSSAVNCGDVFASGYIDANGLIDGFSFRVQGDTVIDSSKQLQVGSATADHNIQGNTYIGDGLNMRLNSSTNSSIVENNAPSGLILRSNYVGSLSHIVFNTNGSTEAMRIRHDQVLLYGTTSVGGEGGITFDSLKSNGAAQQIFNRASTTSTSVVMRFRNGGTNVGQISHNSSSTSYITTSDARLKSNIVDAPSASDDIDAIQVRSFDWIGSGEHQKYGMIAQELQTVAPDAVAEGDEEDDIMGVDYSKLVPMLIKEIQSLRARVAQLEDDE